MRTGVGNNESNVLCHAIKSFMRLYMVIFECQCTSPLKCPCNVKATYDHHSQTYLCNIIHVDDAVGNVTSQAINALF